jgi:hypothetical protein
MCWAEYCHSSQFLSHMVSLKCKNKAGRRTKSVFICLRNFYITQSLTTALHSYLKTLVFISHYSRSSIYSFFSFHFLHPVPYPILFTDWEMARHFSSTARHWYTTKQESVLYVSGESWCCTEMITERQGHLFPQYNSLASSQSLVSAFISEHYRTILQRFYKCCIQWNK